MMIVGKHSWKVADIMAFIFWRSSGRRLEQQARLLLEQLPRVVNLLEWGSVVVIEENRLRVRALPLGGGTGRQGFRARWSELTLFGDTPQDLPFRATERADTS